MCSRSCSCSCTVVYFSVWLKYSYVSIVSFPVHRLRLLTRFIVYLFQFRCSVHFKTTKNKNKIRFNHASTPPTHLPTHPAKDSATAATNLVDDAVPAQGRLHELLFLLEEAPSAERNDHLYRNSRKHVLHKKTARRGGKTCPGISLRMKEQKQDNPKESEKPEPNGNTARQNKTSKEGEANKNKRNKNKQARASKHEQEKQNKTIKLMARRRRASSEQGQTTKSRRTRESTPKFDTRFKNKTKRNKTKTKTSYATQKKVDLRMYLVQKKKAHNNNIKNTNQKEHKTKQRA